MIARDCSCYAPPAPYRSQGRAVAAKAAVFFVGWRTATRPHAQAPLGHALKGESGSGRDGNSLHGGNPYPSMQAVPITPAEESIHKPRPPPPWGASPPCPLPPKSGQTFFVCCRRVCPSRWLFRYLFSVGCMQWRLRGHQSSFGVQRFSVCPHAAIALTRFWGRVFLLPAADIPKRR